MRGWLSAGGGAANPQPCARQADRSGVPWGPLWPLRHAGCSPRRGPLPSPRRPCRTGGRPTSSWNHHPVCEHLGQGGHTGTGFWDLAPDRALDIAAASKWLARQVKGASPLRPLLWRVEKPQHGHGRLPRGGSHGGRPSPHDDPTSGARAGTPGKLARPTRRGSGSWPPRPCRASGPTVPGWTDLGQGLGIKSPQTLDDPRPKW